MRKLKFLVCAFLLWMIMSMAKLQIVEAKSITVEDIPDGYVGIYNIDDLYNIRNNPSANYILMSDIDMTEATGLGGDNDCGSGWDPIEKFSGVFDGNGYRIIGMQIFGIPSVNSIGLFEEINNAYIKNLGMMDVNINLSLVSNDQEVDIGTIAGVMRGLTEIENCWCSGKINVVSDYPYMRNIYVGGMIGIGQNNGKVRNCYNACDIDAITESYDLYVGGIIGYDRVSASQYVNNYNVGVINCGEYSYAGAIVGGGPSGLMFNKCYYLKGSADSAFSNREDTDDRICLTEAQMKKASYFTGFDFDNIWEIDPYCSYNYPQLRVNRCIRVVGLEMVTQPSNVEYFQGDKLNITGATVKVTYEDGYDETIVVTKDMLGNYDMSTIGEQIIDVNMGDLTTQFLINVKEIPVTSVEMQVSEVKVEKKKMVQLKANVLPNNASYPEITWTSSDTTIATVNDKGLVTGKSKGTAIIKAETSNGKYAECEVTVTIPCAILMLDSYSKTLYKNETSTLIPTTSPLDSTDEIVWTSSAPTIVSVSDGVILARGAGKATITATADSGVSASCIVTVKQKLDGFKFNGVEDKAYTGKEITQNFYVTDGETVLKKDVDYKVEYSDNIEAGTATIWVMGIGFYEGTISTTFNITEETYTVQFVNGSKVVKTEKVIRGGSATPPKVTKKGYIFKGWSGKYTNVTQDLILKAKWSKVSVGKAKISSLCNLKGKKFSVKYKKVSGAAGYEIRFATKSSMKGAKKITTAAKSKTVKKLKNKKYYVQVRAYKKDSTNAKIYGKWSSKKSIKIKK